MRELQNETYERELIGSILQDNRILEEVSIAPTDFVGTLTRRCLESIREIRAKGGIADLASVVPLVGSQYVAEVAAMTNAATGNASYYTKELRELSRLRNLATMAREAAELIGNGKGSAEISEHIEERLTAIADDRESGYKKIADYIPGFIADLKKRVDSKGELCGTTCGIEGIDRLTDGWQTTDYVVIGARPSVGKTALALQFAHGAAKAGKRVGFFSLEMSGTLLTTRLVSHVSGVDSLRMRRGLLGSRDMAGIESALGTLYQSNFFICDAPNMALGDFRREARKMRRKDKIDLLFVDYIGLITGTGDAPRHEQVSNISRTLKQTSRELEVPVIALSQLNRAAADEEPTMANLRDSGSIEQDADLIMLLHRLGQVEGDDKKDRLKIKLEKNRNGPCGNIEVIADKTNFRFIEVEHA